MSKKLIAVASAAALALTALVGIAPASATAPAFAIGGGAGTDSAAAGGSTTPRTVNVPHLNQIEVGDTASAISLTVSSLAVGDVVTITSTGSVKFLQTEVEAESANFNASTLGATSFTTTKTNTNSVVVYAYTTSTTAGTIAATVARTGLTSSQTFHIKGIAGHEYNIAATGGVPATLAKGATSVVTFTVTDVFGNAVENSVGASNSVSADAQRDNMGLISWDAAAKVYKSTMTSPSSGPFIASIDLASTDLSVLGMPDSKQELIATVNVSGASTQVATLTAQVAALQVIVDRKVTKKRFNTLARKWNAAFPSQKVKLKK
jgi:hypothetical protein